ncbi:MAG: hypothetical protein AAF648_13385 [Pseudomonadota bacterium]
MNDPGRSNQRNTDRVANLPDASRRQLLQPILLALVLSGLFVLSFLVNEGGRAIDNMDRRQLIGTCLLFVLLPTYFVAVLRFQQRRGPELLATLQAVAPGKPLATLQERYRRVPSVLAGATLVIGACFGLTQNYYLVSYLRASGSLSSIDLAIMLGNALVWALATLVLCWKLDISFRLRRLGAQLDVDPYRLQTLRPMGHLATLDVLMVAGALAFMPLQALDAEFRIENFQWGLIIGVPAAVLFFFLPMLGVRQRIRACKAARIAELEALETAIPRDEVTRLELHWAHLERVRGLSDWPLDVPLVARTIGYAILAPMAWVAAALVEQALDQWT